jgi:hypothetical protein
MKGRDEGRKKSEMNESKQASKQEQARKEEQKNQWSAAQHAYEQNALKSRKCIAPSAPSPTNPQKHASKLTLHGHAH